MREAGTIYYHHCLAGDTTKRKKEMYSKKIRLHGLSQAPQNINQIRVGEIKQDPLNPNQVIAVGERAHILGKTSTLYEAP